MNISEAFREEVAVAIQKKTKLPKKSVIQILEKPPEGIDADLAFPCFIFSKKLKKNPAQIAREIAEEIKPAGLMFMVRSMGPYVNFNADWNKMGTLLLKQITSEKGRYGSGRSRRKVLLEHTSANPDGPLHIGHFRNSVLGDSVARILRFAGNNVKTEFLVNDTGRQSAIASMEYERTKPKVKGKPDWWFVDLYVAGHKRLEKEEDLENELRFLIHGYERGDKTIIKRYDRIVDNCIKGHKQTLDKLDIHMDSFVKESNYVLGKGLPRLFSKLKRLKQTHTDGKRIWVDLKKFGVEREFTLTRSDGTSIYPARDLAYHLDKFFRADKNINVIGTDQKFYFKQIRSALSLLEPVKAANYDIVFYEFLILPQGSMSTRRGNFVSMDDLIDNALKAAQKVVRKKMPHYSQKLKEDIAYAVGIGALKYAMIKVSPEKTYTFNIDDALSFDGDTAPYMQYTHARACSILEKSGSKSFAFARLQGLHNKEKELIKVLSGFPKAVERSYRDLRPHYIANYSYKLAKLFNEFYHELPVLKAGKEQRAFRLALVRSVQVVLENALGLLGIKAPEKM